MNKDSLFSKHESNWAESFAFNDEVVEVFDDMVSRSVPLYAEMQEMIGRVTQRFSAGNTVYDLGCSTGATLEKVLKSASVPMKIVGIDSSLEMLNKCSSRLEQIKNDHECRLKQEDLENISEFAEGPADTVILSLVLQFLRPLRRLDLLKLAYNSLRAGGGLMLTEKVLFKNRAINSLILEEHWDHKRRNGYSEMEIANKREALENRLIPFHPEENLTMLEKAGFTDPAIIFASGPFQLYLAIK